MSSNASKEWSGTFKELTQKQDKLKKQIRYHLKTHREMDEQASHNEEPHRRTQQTIETLSQAADKIDDFIKKISTKHGAEKNQEGSQK